jgi:hypothetical protein
VSASSARSRGVAEMSTEPAAGLTAGALVVPPRAVGSSRRQGDADIALGSFFGGIVGSSSLLMLGNMEKQQNE